MKLHLHSFNCQFDETSEQVVVLSTNNLSEFLSDYLLTPEMFCPDFVSENLQTFVFCINNPEWDVLVNNIYRLTETKVILHQVNSPEDLNIYRYFNCNPVILHYILHPDQRTNMFLMEATMRASTDHFINKMYDALKNPKVSKIPTLYKFKMLWNKDSGFGSHNLLSYSRRILTSLSHFFPQTYSWIFFNCIKNNKHFSERFRNDFFISYSGFLDRIAEIDTELDLEEGVIQDENNCFSLPF